MKIIGIILAALITVSATSAKAQNTKLITSTVVAGINPVGFSTDKLELKDVTPCVFGSMDLIDSGWLVAQDGRKVDYHSLISNSWVNSMADADYITAKDQGKTVTVCQIDGNIRYGLR